MGMPVEDQDIMNLVSQERDPMLLEAAKKEYPILDQYDIGYKYSPKQDSGYLEFFPADEPGSPERPRPKEFPMGKIGVEVYDPKTRPIDMLGDITSHYLIYEDPQVKQYYDQFQNSLNIGQYDRLRNQYQFAQQNYGEQRPYEDGMSAQDCLVIFVGMLFSNGLKILMKQPTRQNNALCLTR
jgi:hypothetical protein